MQDTFSVGCELLKVLSARLFEIIHNKDSEYIKIHTSIAKSLAQKLIDMLDGDEK